MAQVIQSVDAGPAAHDMTESRRNQEEGGELDSHEEVRPEEIKRREVELGLRVGLLLLRLFPNGGATDIVFVTLFCLAVGTATAWCGGRCAMPDGHCLNILLFCRRSTAALVFGLATISRFHSSVPLSHSSRSLTGLLAFVNIKQKSLSPAASSFPSVPAEAGRLV